MVLRPTFSADDCRILAREPLWQGFFRLDRVTLAHATFAGDDSGPVQRVLFERGDAVAVLPYDPVADEVLLVEQFRVGALRTGGSPWLLELVAGIVEDGESAIEVARREAVEEAGAMLGECVPVATYFPSPGACSEQLRVYCARLLSGDHGAIHGLDSESEDICVHRVARAAAIAALDSGWVTSSHTVIALQWLALHGAQLRQRWLDTAS